MLASCAPSPAEQASERLNAAWAATERLDANAAEADLAAALEISEDSVNPVREALEARIAAVRLWNNAQVALIENDFLAAIAALEDAATTDEYFRTRAVGEIRSARSSFIDESVAAVKLRLDAGDAVAAFEALALVHEAYPDEPALAPLRAEVAAVFLPILADEIEPVLATDEPASVKDRLDAALSVLGDSDPVAQTLTLQLEEAITRVADARRQAEEEERSRQAEAARIAAEEARRARDALFAKITCLRDELERRNRCYDKATYSRTPSNRMYLYTVQDDGRNPLLAIRWQTRGGRWLFWEWARVYVGNETFDINPPYRDLVRDNGAGDTWESYARQVTPVDLRMIRAISSRGEAYVRFVNDDGLYREHRLTNAQISAIQNMLAYWNEIS